MTTTQNPFAGTNERLREQVLEVIFRQAMAGAPWRQICEGPMRVNNIDPSEIDVLVSYSRRQLEGGPLDITDSERSQLNKYWADWALVLDDLSIVDRERTSKAVERVYQLLGNQPPLMIFCDSPAQLALFPMIANLIQTKKLKGPTADVVQVFNQALTDLNDTEKDSFWNALESDLPLMMQSSKKTDIGAPLGTTVDQYLWRNLTGKLRTQMQQKVSADLYAALRQERNRLPDRMVLRRLYSDVPVNILTTPALAEMAPFMFRGLGVDLNQSALTSVQLDCRGIWDMLDLSRYCFKPELFDEESKNDLESWLEFGRCAPAYRLYENVCFVCSRPAILTLNERGRLHNEDGPAASFSDGFRLWGFNGAIVPNNVIEDPASITYQQIEQSANVEVRHVLITRYGLERFIKDSGARLVQSDQFGKLYRKDTAGRDPIVMVQVQNSTAEPDGSRKNYFLMVPPTVRTARQAVAWTFGMNPQEYKPDIET